MSLLVKYTHLYSTVIIATLGACRLFFLKEPKLVCSVEWLRCPVKAFACDVAIMFVLNVISSSYGYANITTLVQLVNPERLELCTGNIFVIRLLHCLACFFFF